MLSRSNPLAACCDLQKVKRCMRKLLNFDYAAIQSIYWMLYSAAGIYVAVFLLDKGYSNTSIGTIIAVGSALAILFQAVITNITDRAAKVTNLMMIKVLILALYVMVGMVLLIGEKSLALTIAYIGLIVIHTAMHPFVNALSFTLEETGHSVSYGLGRSMASLFAGILCFLMGYLVAWFSPDIILYIALINLTLMTVMVFATDRHYKNGLAAAVLQEKIEAAETETVHTISMQEFFSSNKMFVVMSLGIAGLFFGNVIVENFTIQIVEGIGGNTEDMGVVIFLMSILEMPAMLGFTKLKERFSYVFLIRMAVIFFTAKIAIMFLAESMVVFYLAQLCQILGYGLLFPAFVSFIDHIMEKGEALRGQAVFTAAITVGNIIGSIFGGIILDAYNSHVLLMVGSAVSACGTIIIAAMIKSVSLRTKIEKAKQL